MKRIYFRALLAIASLGVCNAQGAGNVIKLELMMSNTSWEIVIREAHLTPDKSHLNIVAELVAPKGPVGRAQTRIADSIILDAPAVPIKFWIIGNENWYWDQRLETKYQLKAGRADTCSRVSSCKFVLPNDKGLKIIRNEKALEFKRISEPVERQ